MSCSDFPIEEVKKRFNLRLEEGQDRFAVVPPVDAPAPRSTGTSLEGSGASAHSPDAPYEYRGLIGS